MGFELWILILQRILERKPNQFEIKISSKLNLHSLWNRKLWLFSLSLLFVMYIKSIVTHLCTTIMIPRCYIWYNALRACFDKGRIIILIKINSVHEVTLLFLYADKSVLSVAIYFFHFDLLQGFRTVQNSHEVFLCDLSNVITNCQYKRNRKYFFRFSKIVQLIWHHTYVIIVIRQRT